MFMRISWYNESYKFFLLAPTEKVKTEKSIKKQYWTNMNMIVNFNKQKLTLVSTMVTEFTFIAMTVS